MCVTCVLYWKFCPQLSVGPRQGSETMAVVLEDVDMLSMSISELMAEVTSKHRIPQVKQMQLLTHLRLAKNFSSFQHRLKCVMARLQAISVLGEERERGRGRERESYKHFFPSHSVLHCSSRSCGPSYLRGIRGRAGGSVGD